MWNVTIRSWLQANHRKNEQFRRDVQAANVRSVQGLAGLSDEELTARDPSIPFRRQSVACQKVISKACAAGAECAADLISCPAFKPGLRTKSFLLFTDLV